MAGHDIRDHALELVMRRLFQGDLDRNADETHNRNDLDVVRGVVREESHRE